MPSIFDDPSFNARLFFPRPDATPPPPTATDVMVPVKGASLHLRLHHTVPGAPVLLLFHGNGETVGDYDGAAAAFGRAGVNLAVVDYRGYGQSGGMPTLRNTLEDVDAVVAAAAPAFIMGRSLGSACAAEVYARPPTSVHGVILESGFVDLSALIRRRGLTPPASFTAEELATFGARGKLQQGSLPLLVLHGEDDAMISPDEARVAFQAANTTSKTLVAIPGRGHNDLSASPRYWSALATFVAACG